MAAILEKKKEEKKVRGGPQRLPEIPPQSTPESSGKKKRLDRIKPALIIILALLVATLAGFLRWRSIQRLPIDYDEDDYILAGQQYAALMRSGDWTGFTDTNYRPEHPPLAKILNGVGLLTTHETSLLPDVTSNAAPNTSIPRNILLADRSVSGIFGTVEVFILSLMNPLGGFFLAIHTTTIKYTTEAMLEALPASTSLAAVLCYILAKKTRVKTCSRKWLNGWMVASAVFLGLTAASKYIYCVVGFAILIDWFLVSRENNEWKRFFLPAILWGIIAIAVFFAADPYLWKDPIGRLSYSVLFNTGYSTGAHVQEAGFPIWQPFIWMSESVPWGGDRPAFIFALDALIFLLAVFGLKPLWQKERVHGIWLGVATLFLLAWPTKWPQYILILSAPLGLAAAEGVMEIAVLPLQNWWKTRAERRAAGAFKLRSQLRQALPWLIPGLFLFILITIIPLIVQMGIAMTTLRSSNIIDAFHGGLWKSIWEGITGQIPMAINVLETEIGNKVDYIGFYVFQPAMDWIVQNNLLFNNVMWTVVSVFLQLCLGLGAALLLWQKGAAGRKFWQVLFILPWAIPEFIGALMWFNVLEPTRGWLALAVQDYGQKFPFSFLLGWSNNQNLLFLVLLIPAVWYGFPFMMLASSAGLKMIPTDVFDAAAIDGANALQKFRFVIFPLLQPLIIPAIIVRSIFAFNQFYLFQAFFGANPMVTLANSSYYFFYYGEYFISAIINVITVIILVGFVVLFSRLSKASEGVEYA